MEKNKHYDSVYIKIKNKKAIPVFKEIKSRIRFCKIKRKGKVITKFKTEFSDEKVMKWMRHTWASMKL
jgi:hypothetical protein